MDNESDNDLGHGDDSFLDIVANLVGVMIILVVVLGVQSSKFVKASLEKQATQEMADKVHEPSRVATLYYQDVERHQKELALHDMETQYRTLERDAVLEKNLLLKEKINQWTESLDEARKARFVNLQAMTALEQQRNQLSISLNDQLSDSKSNIAEPIVLQHLPTPMARTVFSKELHLMLSNGKVAVVPWDSLVEALKRRVHAMTTSSPSTRKDRFRDQLGPIDGFLMDYSLIKQRGVIGNGYSQGIGEMLSLEKFELTPTEDVKFESVDQAMSGNGRLSIELSGHNSRELVATVWVYPDSFEEYRHLKDLLFARNFLSAARPIPEGVRIGAAPTGSKSSAQ